MVQSTPVKTLQGKTIAILATDGFEQIELVAPRQALDEAGARTMLVSPKAGRVQGFNHHDKGDTFAVDQTLELADVARFDGLLLPGGALNPDALRAIPAAVEFVRKFSTSGKPIAAICHGPWMLVEADIVRGRKVTSWPSIKTDLINAGATWVDDAVVVDQHLVTSRKPADIPSFVDRMIEQFARFRDSIPQPELRGGIEARRAPSAPESRRRWRCSPVSAPRAASYAARDLRR